MLIHYREAIKEDEAGLVEGLVAEFAQKAARKAAAPRRGPVRLGMMRHLLLAIDCSEAMNCQDIKPTRFLCTLKVYYYFFRIGVQMNNKLIIKLLVTDGTVSLLLT